jgi:hypothetical protein
MLARSYQTWLSYTAGANPQDGLQLGCVLLRNILSRVPAFPANGFSKDREFPQFKLGHSGSNSNNSALYINGRSTWRILEGDCSLREKIMYHQLLLGLQRSNGVILRSTPPLPIGLGFKANERVPCESRGIEPCSSWAPRTLIGPSVNHIWLVLKKKSGRPFILPAGSLNHAWKEYPWGSV